ncbi:MAG: hypothetical protein OEW05_02455 [Candidatus Aminicenantes bacterium]|nr:hypothetical protein [Candidatus Aminicenantes bacterium]
MTKFKTDNPTGTTLVFLSVLVLVALVLPQTLFFLFLLAYLVIVFRGEGVSLHTAARISSAARKPGATRSPPC